MDLDDRAEAEAVLSERASLTSNTLADDLGFASDVNTRLRGELAEANAALLEARERIRQYVAMQERAPVVDVDGDRAEMLDRLGMTEREWALRDAHYVTEQYRAAVMCLAEMMPPLPDDDDELPPLPDDDLPPLPDDDDYDDDFAWPVRARSKIVWTPEQEFALAEVDAWLARTNDYDFDDTDPDENFLSLTGAAGTGKSTAVEEIVFRHPEVTLSAMTGKAALRLSEVAGRAATTLHRILYWPPEAGADLRFERLRDPPSKFVIADEASMTTPTVKKHLRQWAKLGVRVLLIGDSYQLPPVITGEELRSVGTEDYSVFTEVEGPVLKTVMRSVGGVLRAATLIRERGEILLRSELDSPGQGYEFVRERNSSERAVEEYLSSDRDSTLLITWRNKIRMRANAVIRTRLGHEGPLPDVGEPVLIKRNGQGMMNGEIVPAGVFETGPKIGSLRTFWMTCGSAEGGRILVTVDGGPKDKGGEWFDGGSPWVENWKAFNIDLKTKMLPEPVAITWGYCVTAHAGQGSQAKKTIVFLERGDERSEHFRKMTTLPDGSKAMFGARWAYTSATRSVEHTVMVLGR